MNIDLFKKENPKFFRRHHLYNFKNVIFRNNNIEIISISSIEEINEDFLFDDYDYKDIDYINDIKDENLFNFKSKLINFSFEEKSINIKEGFTVKLNLNEYLMKNISINGIIYFRNFIKKGNNIESTITSYIIEETYIFIIFNNYQKNNNIINEIIFEDSKIEINNDILKYQIKKKIKFRYYVEKITLIGKEKELSFYEYLYKGQINKFICYINIIGGYFYEFLYDSLEYESLPNKQLIKINNKDIEIVINDDFNNKFKRRFNIININNKK